MGKCPSCGKKGLFLKKQYCHACGKQGCAHCMILLFKFYSNFLRERWQSILVVVCSEDCWLDFATQIEAIIHKNMSEAWSAKEKPAEYDGDEGRHVNEALIRAYLSYAKESPNYPHKEFVERAFKKVRERSKLYENMEITWYYNSKKYEESKNPYALWFPQNQARRAKRGLSYQYERVPYKYEALFEGELAHEDSSEFLFKTLAFSRLRKQEELSGLSSDKALKAVARNAKEVILRERREIVRERIEEERKRMKWYQLRAEEGICDYCNEELKVRDGYTTYYYCDDCREVFCSQRCYAEHLEHVHEE